MKTSLLLFILLAISNLSVHKKRIEGNFSTFTVDNHKNIITVSPFGQLTKYNHTLKQIQQESTGDKRTIESISTLGSLNNILFYKGEQKILILDNFFDLLNEIDLQQFDEIEIEGVALSQDNKIWLIGANTKNLYKIDFKGNIEFKIEDLEVKGVTYNELEKIETVHSEIHLYSKEAIYILDQFGTLTRKYPILGSLNEITKTTYNYLNRDSIYIRNRISLKESKFFIEESEDIQKIHLQHGILYVLRKNGVDLYELDL